MKTKRPSSSRMNKRIKKDAPSSSSIEDNIGVDDTHRFCRNIDLKNREEKYGWISLKKENIPYIIRANEKFCSVKMIEECILKKHFSRMHPGVYCCTNILRYNLTPVESALFPKINNNNVGGKLVDPYDGVTDKMMRIDDAEQLIKFYNFCFEKLQTRSSVAPDSPCGFVRIDWIGAVPFTVKDGKQYVPVFYFAAICNHVNKLTLSPEDWALAYLKFCSRVIGYKKEFLDNYNHTVIKLDDLKRVLPVNTKYQECWP